jgi:hypothetical protein
MREQLELGGREMDLPVTGTAPSPLDVELDSAGTQQLGVIGSAAGAPQHRLHPGDNLARLNGLVT